MWYACLPSAAVICIAMSLPEILTYLDNRFLLGNPYRRYIHNKYDVHTHLRDMRLGNGDPYKQIGLESLSDGD